MDGSESFEPTAVDLGGDLDPVEMQERQPTRRVRKSVALLGVVAMLGAGGFAATVLMGDGGGADSPEAAVRQLADAVNHEDLLAAVAVMAPDEVRSLDRTIDAASRRAAETELVRSASRPLAGVDLSVSGLELDTETLADGFAKVTVGDARIDATIDKDGLAPLVAERIQDVPDPGGVDLGDIGVEPFVVAVRHEGGWYVSAAYTVLEHLRATSDLPAADFGSGRARLAQLGADTPEAAVQRAVEALASGELDDMWAVLPPDEIPVYDYRDALGELLSSGDGIDGFTVEEFSATAEIHGDRAIVNAQGSGKFSEGSWELRGRCVATTFESSDSAFPDEPVFDEQSVYGDIEICLGGRGILPFSFGSGRQAMPKGPADIVAVRREGRWFVSPVWSLLRYLDDWVKGFDRRAALSLIGRAELLEPDGTIELGQEVVGQNAEFGLAYVYEFEGRAGQSVILEGDAVHEMWFPLLAETSGIFDPSGNRLNDPGSDLFGFGFPGGEVELPVDGTYKLVVQAFARGEFRFTLWDAEDAPPSGSFTYGEDDGVPVDSLEQMVECQELEIIEPFALPPVEGDVDVVIQPVIGRGICDGVEFMLCSDYPDDLATEVFAVDSCMDFSRGQGRDGESPVATTPIATTTTAAATSGGAP